MSPASTTHDPSLQALVPQSSPLRNALAGTAGLVLVLSAGWLGTYAQVGGQSPDGGSSLEPGGIVVEEHTIIATGWPGLRLTEIHPPVGARLTDAWLVSAAAAEGTMGASAAELLSTLAEIEQFAGSQLMAPGERYGLVLRLEITDCRAYTKEDAARWSEATGPDPHASTAVLRTALGTHGTVELTAPGWSMDDVERWSECP